MTTGPPVTDPGGISAIDLPSYTESDLRAWHQENLGELANQLGISDPPNYEVVRYVSQQEWGSAQASCVNEAGFDARSSGGGIDYTRIPDAQKGPDSPLYQRIYECHALYPVDPRFGQPPTRAQLTVMYTYFVDELMPCLEQMGIQGLATPPSRSAFVEQSETEGFVAWSPYTDSYFLTLSSDEWQRLDASCPSQTPLDRLWKSAVG